MTKRRGAFDHGNSRTEKKSPAGPRRRRRQKVPSSPCSSRSKEAFELVRYFRRFPIACGSGVSFESQEVFPQQPQQQTHWRQHAQEKDCEENASDDLPEVKADRHAGAITRT